MKHLTGKIQTLQEGSNQNKDLDKKGFFEVFPTVESYVERATDSETTRKKETLPQMRELLGEQDQWNFTPEAQPAPGA